MWSTSTLEKLSIRQNKSIISLKQLQVCFFQRSYQKNIYQKKQQKLFSIVMSWKKREKIYHYYFYPFIHISSYNYENAKKSWLLIDRSILSAVCLLPASASDAGHCWRWQDDSDSCWPQKLLKSAGLLVPVLLRNFISWVQRNLFSYFRALLTIKVADIDKILWNISYLAHCWKGHNTL